MATKAKKQTSWQNKIVGYGEVVPDQALAHDSNWRIHPLAQQKALSDVLNLVGIVDGVIINKRASPEWPDNDRHIETVVDGHLRIAMAISEGQATIPVTFVDLTPAEETLILASLDSVAHMAVADTDMLANLLNKSEIEFPDMGGLLETVASEMSIAYDGQQSHDEKGSPKQQPAVTCPQCGCSFIPVIQAKTGKYG